jgi:hypothetical protein
MAICETSNSLGTYSAIYSKKWFDGWECVTSGNCEQFLQNSMSMSILKSSGVGMEVL